MKVGILGGTFDPIHLGHLVMAEEARLRLELDKVLFVPAEQQWLKVGGAIAAPHQRLEMVRLAINSNPFFKLSVVEMERSGPSYTVDTLAALHDQLGAGAELYFILGWGSLAELPQWREPAQIVQRCQLVAIPRPGYTPPDLESLELDITGISQSTILLDMPVIGISSSEVRRRISQGLSIHYLVPEAVARYIQEQGLYR